MNISVQGAPIYFTIPIFGGIPISATLVVTWLIMAIVTGLCLWLTHDMKVSNVSKRQAVAEFLVETARNFTVGNMGEKFAYFTPFVAALFTLSLLSNLISLVGLYSPTADLSTEAAWAVLVFALITYHKIKANGFGGYLKGFTQPIPVLTPFNILRGAGAGQPRAVWPAAGPAGRCAEPDPLPGCGPAGHHLDLFRLVQRCDAGIHLLYADHHVYRQRRRGGLNPQPEPIPQGVCSA